VLGRALVLLTMPDDVITVIGRHLTPADIVRLRRSCRSATHMVEAAIRGRLTTHYLTVFRTETPPVRLWETMGAVDLARIEAWLLLPLGRCPCCLRDVPLKLGGRCIECVGQELEAFVASSAPMPDMLTRCCSSEAPNVFACPICECAVCFECMVADRACAMCRVPYMTDDAR
jgi:hypothetical protein